MEEGNDQESMQSSTTYGKVTKYKNTLHTREIRGQPFPSRWSQGCKAQTRQYNKDNHETQITKMIQKRRTALERSLKILENGYMQPGNHQVSISFQWNL